MPLFQKIQKGIDFFFKIWNYAFAADPAWFWYDWMKTVADAVFSYYIILY